MKMGMGVVGWDYWSSAQPLANLVDCRSAAFPAKKPGFTYARDGWPTSIPKGSYPDNWMGWVIACTEGYLAPGKYQVWAGGSGKFAFCHPDLAASGQPNSWTTTGPIGGPHRKVAEFTVTHPDAGRTLCCVFETDPNNPLAHIMVIPAGEATSAVFTRQYLEELSHFEALRTGGIIGVVASKEVDWPTGPVNPSGNPARWHSIIRLANETKTDAWINIPHMASDQYVAELAACFEASLDKGLTVYLEYSIEVWNWSGKFGVATKWVEDWGHANISPSAPYQFAAAERAHHVQDVFCRHAPSVKVVRLFADQHGNPWLFWQAGTYMKKKGYKFDAVATAPYAVTEKGPDWTRIDSLLAEGKRDDAMGVLFDDMEASLTELDGNALQYRMHADDLGIPRMIAYECGPGLQIPSNWPASRLDLFRAHHLVPRMHEFLYDTYFPWMARYYDLAMYTSHTIKCLPGEEWGVKSTAGQDPHPKLDACLEWCAAYNS